MSRYKNTILSVSESYKDYGYDELPDAEPYIKLGLLFAMNNPSHFLKWIDSNTQYNKEKMLFEALNSLSKRFLNESIYRSDFDDIVYEYATQNTTIEADYELAREAAVKYDMQDEIDPDDQRETDYDNKNVWTASIA